MGTAYRPAGVEEQLSQPLMHDPDMVRGREGEDIMMGNTVRQAHVPPGCQVPPEVGVRGGLNGHSENGEQATENDDPTQAQARHDGSCLLCCESRRSVPDCSTAAGGAAIGLTARRA